MNTIGSPLHYFGSRAGTISLLYNCFLQGRKFKTVYEPFCGSASFTLRMMRMELGKYYIISDAYKPIIDTLVASVKSPVLINQRYEHHASIIDGLSSYAAKQEYYNKIKQEFNSCGEVEKNIDFIFLNNYTKYNLPLINQGIFQGEYCPTNRLQEKPAFVTQQIMNFIKDYKKNMIEIKSGDFQTILAHSTKHDLVFMDPPFPDLVGQLSIYHRPETADVLHKKLINQIIQLNKSNTAFILLYGTYDADQNYLLDCENLGLDHYLILSKDPIGLYNEYFEHCYVSKKLSKNIDSRKYILVYEEVKHKSYADLINIVKINHNLQVYSEKEQVALFDIRTGKDIYITARENEIIECLKFGYSAKQTANLLHISPRTVEAHIDNLKKKTNSSSKFALLNFINLKW